MSITSLPTPILTYLGDYLEPIDIVRLTQTCKTMKEFYETETLWKGKPIFHIEDQLINLSPDLRQFLLKAINFPKAFANFANPENRYSDFFQIQIFRLG